MSSISDIILNQQQLAGAIENVYTNFKKDGAERKTSEYLKRRLDILDSYWMEYEGSYKRLIASDLDASTRDHVEQEMERVRDRYGNVRAHIQNYQATGSEVPKMPILKPPTFVSGSEGTSSTQPKTSKSVKVTSKTEDMLKKQQSNFKAFHRTVQAINLDKISEKWEFDDILRTVQSRWSAIDSMHWDLDSELEGSNQGYEQTFSAYEEQYEAIKKAINKKMWSVAHMEKSTPKMEIPTFGGNYNYWVSFKDLFSETIHCNSSMSKAQKMQYLRSKVKGEAEKLIQHLHISADNYDVCWDILNQRYNNERLIFVSHMHTLMNIPSMQNQSVALLKRMHDTTKECLNAIKNLGVDTSSWDPILVYLLTQKLDTESYTDYMESVKNPRGLPILKELMEFLELKFTTLEASRRKHDNSIMKNQVATKNNTHQKPNYYRNAYTSNNKLIAKHSSSPPAPSASSRKFASAKYKCSLCNNNEHGIYFCPKFLEMSPYSKLKAVTRLSLCPNCLFNHQGQECRSGKVCRDCNQDHNSLLHEAFMQSARPTIGSGGSENTENGKQVRNSINVSLQSDPVEVLLPTAMIQIQAVDGSYHVMRALLDQGSQTSLITEKAAQFLRLPRKRCNGIISGIGDKETNGKGIINIKCKSTINNFSFETDAIIMRQLVKNLPNQSFNNPDWSYLDHIELADPKFYKSRPVDLLLGADIYSIILLDGVFRAKSSLPTAQQTQLGWILSGHARTFQCNVVLHSIEDMQKFWELENITDDTVVSTEDQECVEFYQSTTIRREDGRYEVRLPLKPNYQEKLGHSKTKAVAQFYKLEQKFKRNKQLENDYKLFINEYLSLGHMMPADSDYKLNNCYLPHHGVIRAESTTTKLRVVFNASEKTSTGLSLNDVMHRGPNLQQDLQSLLIKWRQYRYAFTADLEKMFRQIWLNKQDQDLQMIVWRDSLNSKLTEFKLATVTYGTKAAPFLAMMTLKQLANDEKNNYQGSLAPAVLENSFYMDDLIYGSNSIPAAIQLQNDLIHLLSSGGFNLRKWKSNSSELLHNVHADQKQQDSFNFKQVETTKTLGLRWCPQDDYFTFCPSIASYWNPEKLTKRKLLSELSKVYDPLGWLSPVTIKLKLLFQDVWRANILWDEAVPRNIYEEWQLIREHLALISEYRVPRWLQTEEKDTVQLHGFCDASTKAYAAVVYIKVQGKNHSTITLVAAKTKVVPLNSHTSIPRLELCGSVLLAKLITKIKSCLAYHTITVFAWVDSMAVLGWLNGDSNRWKAFVANRVNQVTDSVPATCWRYVKSKENPADCASRGMTPSRLADHSLWWQGPSWLPDYKEQEEQPLPVYSTNEELKQVNFVTNQDCNSIINELLEKYSSFARIVRILAWVLRFTRSDRKSYLTLNELRLAKEKIIKFVQKNEFQEELQALKKHEQVSQTSKTYKLNPYLDRNGLMRVKGRLENSFINNNMKHPIILPTKGTLTALLIDQAHELTFHGGARLTSSFIRQNYWIIGGNKAIKKQLRECVKCRKNCSKKQEQLMGDLPEARSNPARPFYHTGVDFTGYLDVKLNKGRGVKTTKGYVAVFICMATKAVHLELVSDLTSSAFLAGLRRMAARRGTPRHIYCDNGTNFVGASRILEQEQLLMTEITDMGIEFHFNAPSWPSAGGIWEAAVKSLKYHLKRVIGEQKLTFEEYVTLLSQLEACLNSRPLCPLTEDIDDLDCLTPAHFLAQTGDLTFIETEHDARTRWQLTQKLTQDIWKRWKAEYLSQLSARSKWTEPKPNIEIGRLVTVHDDNLPPGKWLMGKIIELHPGKDGYVRVVTLKTKNSIIQRPISKLSLLPVKAPEENTDKTKSLKDKPKLSKQSSFRAGFLTLALSLTLFLNIFIPSTTAYNIKTLNKNQTLYFDHISNMKLVRDDWKAIVYYNMEPYWEGTQALNKYLTHLNSVCDVIKGKSHCEELLLQLRHSLKELEYYNHMLLGQQNTGTRRRRRRGLINGVGYLANSLFGVLDEHFAEQYQKDITLVRENQKHLASLLRNQTSVIEVENNLIKRTSEIMSKQHKCINQRLNEIGHSNNILKTEIETSEKQNDFTASAIIANNILINLKSIQDTLVDTITDIYYGRFNAHLLNPQQLQKELNMISGYLTQDITLPISDIQADLHNIYRLLKVKARLTEKYLIFEVKIPLISRDTYEIYKIIPIPQMTGNNTASIIPVAKFIALNFRKDTFIPMTEINLQACLQFESLSYLCHIKEPIYQRKSDNDLCRKNKQAHVCDTQITACKNTWIELYEINTYFYYCCSGCTIRIVCHAQLTAVQKLSDCGILSLEQDCLINSDDDNFVIYSHKEFHNNLNTKSDIYSPEFATINHLINITIPKTENVPKTMKASTNDSSELSASIDLLGERVKEIIRQNTEEETISFHDVHHYVAIYVLLILVAVIVVGLLWYVKSKRASAALAAPTGAAVHAAYAPAASVPPPAPAALAATAAVATAGQGSPPSALCSDMLCSELTKNRARVSFKNKCTPSTVQSASARVVVKDIGLSPIVHRSIFYTKDE